MSCCHDTAFTVDASRVTFGRGCLREVGDRARALGMTRVAVFSDPTTAVRSAIAAREAIRAVDVDGFTPRMRVGIHTGRPQRIGSDWLGVDVNLAARVMERATRGELIVSAATLDRIPQEEFDTLGVTARKLRRQMFAPKQDGVPPDFVMYRLKSRKPADEDDGEATGS